MNSIAVAIEDCKQSLIRTTFWGIHAESSLTSVDGIDSHEGTGKHFQQLRDDALRKKRSLMAVKLLEFERDYVRSLELGVKVHPLASVVEMVVLFGANGGSC